LGERKIVSIEESLVSIFLRKLVIQNVKVKHTPLSHIVGATEE
jgi:hypothetical protein